MIITIQKLDTNAQKSSYAVNVVRVNTSVLSFDGKSMAVERRKYCNS